MNPFDLAGPPFLLFYVVFAIATVWILGRVRRASEDGDPGRVSLTDPYAIAYLRGGSNEVLRVASVALADRGLLVPSSTTLETRKDAHAKHPLEAALLEKYREFGAATAIFTDKGLAAATEPLRASLTDLGLLPGHRENQSRARLFALGLAILLTVSGARLVQASSRGQRNVVFLIVLSIFAAIAASAAAFPRRTAKGDRLLDDLRTLFSGLRERAPSLRAHAASPEVALLAAVFGVGLLPAGDFGWIRKAFPKSSYASESASSSCGSGCGSSSGSSSGSSCGSSCGGGCGGGCGGCGG